MSTNLEVGILGLSKTGKTTLFNALTKSKANTDAYSFTNAEPNVGIAKVPDNRLYELAKLYQPKKITPTSIKFVDIVGLSKGAAGGSGLGNKFLAHIREADALVAVIRCFDDENIPYPDGVKGSIEQLEILNIELCLADLEVVERRIERTKKMLKGGEKKYQTELDFLGNLKAVLEEGKPARQAEIATSEYEQYKELVLLTLKPVIYVANIAESDLNKKNEQYEMLKKYAEETGTECIAVPAKLDAELSELSEEEAIEMANEMGLEETGLNKLIRACYKRLGLISFLTAGEPEVRAWTIRQGMKAPQAAGKIHSDIERGFIRAETVAFEDLMNNGSLALAKEKGLVRLEGKDYVVKDGDVINFRFNV